MNKDEDGNLVLTPYDCMALALVWGLICGGFLALGFILGWWLM